MRACTYDVCIEEGEGGGSENQTEAGRLRYLYGENEHKGGGGSKMPQIMWTSYINE